MPSRGRRASLGVDLDAYEALLERQGGGCAICGNKPKNRRLDTDHDHRTGKVRGLLCHWCNRTLGPRITPQWLQAAGRYLLTPPTSADYRSQVPAAHSSPGVICRYCGSPGEEVCDRCIDLVHIELYGKR